MSDQEGERPGDPGRESTGEAAAGLPREIRPKRDLWPGIVARISHAAADRGGAEPAMKARRAPRAPRPAFAGPLRVAAAALAVVMVVWIAVEVFVRRPAGDAALGRSVAATIQAVESECERTRSDLQSVLARPGMTLPPQTIDVIESNLEIIEFAIRDSREALRQNPTDAGLARRLTSDYREQLKLLRRAARLSVWAAAEAPSGPGDET
jgi:hypothetical protein